MIGAIVIFPSSTLWEDTLLGTLSCPALIATANMERHRDTPAPGRKASIVDVLGYSYSER